MKKRTTWQESRKWSQKGSQGPITIGIDLGDKSSCYCVLDGAGEVARQGRFATTKKGLSACFGALPRCLVALEVGTHSAWVSRLLKGLGFEGGVANARQVKLISQSSRKDDQMDAEMLARLARVDPKLLRPIRHRSEKAQGDLLGIRVRAALVDARTALVNTARGLTKAIGYRLPSCDTDQMGVGQMQELPEEIQQSLQPLLKQVESLTEQIKECDRKLEQIARTEYPEVELLKQVSGVGNLIALTFVLTVEDPKRFEKSRDVGCYVGLRPRRSNSGNSEPELRITKEGDAYLRKMLVQGAHYVLSRKGPDTDLKRWGQKLAGRGKKNAKKRAVVAVARKLGILLHRLWTTGEVYEPLRNSQAGQRTQQAA
jgi:transposase